MSEPTAILAGALAALLLVGLARLGGRRLEGWVYSLGLVVAALVYVVAAARAGGGKELLVEAVGLAAFGTIALVGLLFSPLVLALGWALHVGWDLVLHPGTGAGSIPYWYPAVCFGFDLLIAAYVAASLRGGGILRPRPAAGAPEPGMAPVGARVGAPVGARVGPPFGAAAEAAATQGPAPDWGVDPSAETDPLAEGPDE